MVALDSQEWNEYIRRLGMSTLRTNALEGVDAKNSITIVAGAGNVTTTNVQEGLAKIFCSIQDNETLLSTSLNTSSWTDTTTGSGLFDFTNAFNASFSSSGCCIKKVCGRSYKRNFKWGVTNSRYDTRSFDGSNSATDHSFMSFVIHGRFSMTPEFQGTHLWDRLGWAKKKT